MLTVRTYSFLLSTLIVGLGGQIICMENNNIDFFFQLDGDIKNNIVQWVVSGESSEKEARTRALFNANKPKYEDLPIYLEYLDANKKLFAKNRNNPQEMEKQLKIESIGQREKNTAALRLVNKDFNTRVLVLKNNKNLKAFIFKDVKQYLFSPFAVALLTCKDYDLYKELIDDKTYRPYLMSFGKNFYITPRYAATIKAKQERVIECTKKDYFTRMAELNIISEHFDYKNFVGDFISSWVSFPGFTISEMNVAMKRLYGFWCSFEKKKIVDSAQVFEDEQFQGELMKLDTKGHPLEDWYVQTALKKYFDQNKRFCTIQ